MKMNSVVGGIGQTDGILQNWVDGALVQNYSNMIYRTGQHPTMKWAQFVIAPYIGNGAPVTETFYMDNLTVGTAVPYTNAQVVLPNVNLGLTLNPVIPIFAVDQTKVLMINSIRN